MKYLINNQHVNVEGRTQAIAVHWCLKALQLKNWDLAVDVFQALDALLRKKTNNVNMVSVAF